MKKGNAKENDEERTSEYLFDLTVRCTVFVFIMA